MNVIFRITRLSTLLSAVALGTAGLLATAHAEPPGGPQVYSVPLPRKDNAVKMVDFVKESRAGTTVMCEGGQVGGGMGVPLYRLMLECANGKTVNMEDFTSNGWSVTSHSVMPDGDFGGYPQYRHTFVLKKG